MPGKRVKVAINGYGVIGKRVADAVVLQDDMELAGICDIIHDYRIRVALEKGYPVFASTPEKLDENELTPALESMEEIRGLLTGKRPFVALDYDGTLTPIVVWIYYRLARREEKAMLKKFGGEYENYMQQVPMFFPELSDWPKALSGNEENA
jgi:hypothetical protein